MFSMIAKKWKQPECPSNDEWIYPYNRKLINNKKERSSNTSSSMEESLIYAEQEKPNIKE